MTDSARVFISSGWRGVDASGDAEFYVRYLDRAAAGPLRAARREIISALDVRPDSSVLDVGSGVGEFLIELAEAVPGGGGRDGGPVQCGRRGTPGLP
jgi:hypothetical protein